MATASFFLFFQINGITVLTNGYWETTRTTTLTYNYRIADLPLIGKRGREHRRAGGGGGGGGREACEGEIWGEEERGGAGEGRIRVGGGGVGIQTD